MNEDMNLFTFSETLEDSSFWLQKEPENSRILRLMQEKLEQLVEESSSKDLRFLADFLNSYINQLWINLAVDFTYQSGSPGRKILISLMRKIGKELDHLATSIRQGEDYHPVLVELSSFYQEALSEIRRKENLIRDVKVTIGGVTRPDEVTVRLKKLCDVIERGGAITQSVYTLAGGSPSDYFFDSDKMMSRPEFVKTLSAYYAREIRKVTKRHRIDKLAFIEKGVGTIGILPLMGLIISKTKMNGMIIRVQKQVNIGSIKSSRGTEPTAGEVVAIVSDVATAGEGVIKAASAIRRGGASVAFAFVLYDREQGAKQTLARNGIELRPVATYTQLEKIGLVPRKKGPLLTHRIPIPPPKIAEYSATENEKASKTEKKIMISFTE